MAWLRFILLMSAAFGFMFALAVVDVRLMAVCFIFSWCEAMTLAGKAATGGEER